MAQLVLHAHMPYVLDTAVEYWLHEVVLNCYLPLIEMIESSSAAKIVMHISPTILAQCSREDFSSKYHAYCETRLTIANLIPCKELRDQEKKRIARYRDASTILARFKSLQQAGKIRILTGLAAHAFCPLLRADEIKLHVKMGMALSCRFFGDTLGIWTPECALNTEISSILHDTGIKYTYADPACLSFSADKVMCRKLKLFIRDVRATNLIWDSETGYPGHFSYRDFHSDFSLESREALDFLHKKNILRAGFSLRAIDDRNSSIKSLYDSSKANSQISIDANHFVKNLSGSEVLAFDAELFGHWWHEGILFLKEVFDLVPNSFFHFPEEDQGPFQEVDILPSTWGTMSDASSWINTQTAPFLDGIRLPKKASVYDMRARMLAQASDWLFLISHDSFKDEAIAMIETLRKESPKVDDAFTEFLLETGLY
ncbi:MAG: hypothetical protein ACRCY4_07310 [Brevinema sp.]